MSVPSLERPVSALRQRMLEDMAMRGLRSATRRDYIRFVRSFAAFLKRPPDTATAEDIRRFQVYQHESGVQAPTINCSVSALRFFFTVTLDRPDLSRRLVLARSPRKLPDVLSVEEVGRLLAAAPGIKYKAVLGTAYGAGLRVSEVASLRVDDIDSTRMLIRVEQGKGRKDRNAMHPSCSPCCGCGGRTAGVAASCCPMAGCSRGRRRSGLDPAGQPRGPRGRRSGRDQEAGVASYAAAQLRHPSLGAGCRYPCDPGPAGTQQARYDRALRAGGDQDDPRGDQSARAFGIADGG
jgi:Phage integrase, N-terminal SAM-like domain/Phage integrase family